MLKLLELGVNPLEFDFVESPPRSSLEIAMGSLQEIDTVKDGAITELGRWVAKLPLEPRLGVLVKNGIDKGVPIEAMVLAACYCSSGMFFRMGTEAEKKAADVQKTKFCHPGGDMMTMLNVFKDWHTVNEKDKGKWCKENSINGKSMKGIRETINETLTILKREMKEDIKFELKQGNNTDELLQGLVIKCMKSNVCCFLGHEQAGYITTKQLQHVQIHPSSSMKSLGQTPRFLVYWQLLQTSRTFITNLTPVDEDSLKKSETQVTLEINEEEIQRQCVSLTGKFPVGNLVFRKFVGPLHKNRREKEEQIRALCENTIVIIEANREVGEIQLFCNQKFSSFANAQLLEEIKSFTEPLKQQTVEVHLGKNESGVRAILGDGGMA
ncbi:MAG: oligonucleotide/oligosaccharide-binding fold domain-containing protein [Candidatus Thiodiazotropha sp.]